MSVLETAILFEGEELLSKKFYSLENAEVIDKNKRETLLSAIVSLSKEAFEDSIQSFSIGDYIIIMITHQIEDLKDIKKKIPIHMFSIAQKGIDKGSLESVMNKALFQFLNRFSRFDIFKKRRKNFLHFIDRFEKIFKKFIIKDSSVKEKDYNEAKRRNIEGKSNRYNPYSSMRNNF